MFLAIHELRRMDCEAVMAFGKNKASKIKNAENAIKAMELRKAGCTFKEIGKQLGFSEQRAHAIVTNELALLRGHLAESASDVLTLELQRLDSLFVRAYTDARAGDVMSNHQCIRIMERRARLLGLDAPVKADVDLHGADGGPVEFELSQLSIEQLDALEAIYASKKD
jgi:hypothetical protein